MTGVVDAVVGVGVGTGFDGVGSVVGELGMSVAVAAVAAVAAPVDGASAALSPRA